MYRISVFLEMNKIKQQYNEGSELLKKRLEEIKHHEIEIQFEDNWVNLMTNFTKIGTVTITSRPLDVKSGILGGRRLTDGIFLPDDKVLLVDYIGGKVIFCTLEGQVHKELSVSGYPCSIVQIDDRQAAVVLYSTQNIQYIDIVNCKLGKLIMVIKQLSGVIGYNGTNLIVGGTDGNIYMIDRTGNIIKTVTLGCSTNYITCTTDRIYLTSYDKLVCLDMNGSLMFSYLNDNVCFADGRGISVDKDGQTIHQLTPDGQFIKLIVRDITLPYGIAFDKTGKRFLVTHDVSSILHKGNSKYHIVDKPKKHNKAVSWCTVCNEALCTDCDHYHKAMKISQSHKIYSLEQKQSETRTITTLEVCTQHEGEKMKLYCMDHKQACCAICVTVHHRKCEHVKTLNDAAKGSEKVQILPT
ncbi:hypothetical protein KUTeg_011230 [Tegillarca granosa]|uniref:B box-type domain-containing protein n=1 Tax=Tegillarca granosa TaxID=220873 RepID=A0ABQ9F6J4_TEGGR|nr:hypothetical protein KUTeg_011230 [Tegillarca granosa]